MIRGRLRRHRQPESAAGADEDYVEIDPSELSGIFTVPQWLRDLGLLAWLLVGVALLIVGMVWILGLTQVIVIPVIVAAVIAAVASPLVAKLNAHHVPRVLGAALLLLAIIALGPSPLSDRARSTSRSIQRSSPASSTCRSGCVTSGSWRGCWSASGSSSAAWSGSWD